MPYISTVLKPEFYIDKIITIHYFEYTENFCFKGESHDFWEFLCVDRGEVEVRADENIFSMKKNDIIFHKPMEFHAVKSCSNTAPNLVVCSFECKSEAMNFFNNKVLSVTDKDRLLLSKIISEARLAFSTPLHIPSVEQVILSPTAPFGCMQLIKLYLEELLIGFVRQETAPRIRNSTPHTGEKLQQKTLERILQYLELHICDDLTVEMICNDNLIGRSYLQSVFHNEMKCGVMEYFNRMKIEVAKQMIRDKDKNFTEIADDLCFSASSYFSKKFKQITGMSPSEYASSIKSLSDEVSNVIPAEKKISTI